jgi:hypothetical protein
MTVTMTTTPCSPTIVPAMPCVVRQQQLQHHMWCNDGTHNTHTAQQLWPQHHMQHKDHDCNPHVAQWPQPWPRHHTAQQQCPQCHAQHDDSNRSTICGTTLAPMTPMQCNNHDHNTTHSMQLQLWPHALHDDSNCNTKCGAMMATATPMQHDDSTHNTIHSATTATTKLTGLTETCTEKLYVVAITLVINKITPPGIVIPTQALVSAFTFLSQPGPTLLAYTMSFPTMRTCIDAPQ